jgi:hypothetical protein
MAILMQNERTYTVKNERSLVKASLNNALKNVASDGRTRRERAKK